MAEPAVGTPEWYRDKLTAALSDQQSDIALYDEYYEGQHRLAFATSKFRQTFGNLFSEFADNWCDLVVDAVEERLNVDGFRFGDDTAGDTEAWNIWQRNQMDAYSQQGHLEALINREAAVLVWWDDNDEAEITVEHPAQMIVSYEPGNPTRRLAALKLWDTLTGTRCNLYRPDGVWKWVREGGAPSVVVPSNVTYPRGSWQPYQPDGEEWPLANPLGAVPVVPLVNRPRLLRPAASEIKKVVPVQDAINKMLMDMVIASEFQGFRQRWATGIEMPTIYDENGNPISQHQQFSELWQHAVDRLWYTDDPEVKFGEFSATDLQPFTVAIEMLVQHVASQTRTPPHYFYLSGQFPSGESIKSAETGLVAKAYRKQRFFGEAWEEVMRLAFAVQGDSGRATDYRAETIWGDAESRTESEHVDAVTKKAALGVPLQQLWEDLGYSPQQIQRFRAMRAAEAADQTGLAAALATALDGAGRAEPAALPEGGDGGELA